MFRLYVAFTLMAMVAVSVAKAQQLDYVYSVSTPGEGRLVTVDNYWLLAFSHTYDIRLPEHVSQGDKVMIEIKQDDSWQAEAFTVTAISIFQDLCRLHRQHPSQDGRFPSDAIYIQPCRSE
ncbi:hypothetical protein P0Y67_03390 [Photobacterium sp. SP02]|uniref:hypothetical protein n=1 Tax=Photobacterium sp. SP02 TaxID=3032280 RepID=UPI003144E2F4